MRPEYKVPTPFAVEGEPDEHSLAMMRILNDCYPSHQAPRLKYSEVWVLALAIAPQSEFDMWDFLRSNHGMNPQDNALLDDIVGGVYRLYRDRRHEFVKDVVPDERARVILRDLADTVTRTPDDLEQMTLEVYDCGKRHFAQSELRTFFQTVYECLLGQGSGPRLPTYVIMLGRERFLQLVNEALARS